MPAVTVPAIILRLRDLRADLSKSERKVCDYIVENPSEVVHMAVSELAEATRVSDATVIRTSKKLGFESYQDFKILLAQNIVTPIQSINEEITKDDDTGDIMKKVFQGIIHTMNYTYEIQDAATLEKAADYIVNARHICIVGLGNSHAVAEDVQHKFLRLGLDASAFSDTHLQVIRASSLNSSDVLFAISHSGSSKDVVHAAKIAHENHARVISITNIGKSPLANISDIALHTSSDETKYRHVALASRLAQMAIVDVIYTMIALKINSSTDRFVKIEKALSFTKY